MSGRGNKLSEIRDKIWLTSKSRMQAEARYNLYRRWSRLLLSYYALILIIVSIFFDSTSSSFPISKINVALSVIIFGTSLIVYGFGFGDRAKTHRDCYMRLQELLDSPTIEGQLGEEYHKIMSAYPNHATRDYYDLVIDRTLFGKEGLTNSGGKISYSWQMMCIKLLRFGCFWLFVLNAFLGPLFLMYCVYSKIST